MNDRINGLLQSVVNKYLNERVDPVRNHHMNELLLDERIDRDDIDVILNKYWEYVQDEDIEEGVVSKINLLKDLKGKADWFVNNHSLIIDQRIVEAVVVDFINYLGARMWVDYGLYTQDLNKAVVVA